jgi:hypothetical protein
VSAQRYLCDSNIPSTIHFRATNCTTCSIHDKFRTLAIYCCSPSHDVTFWLVPCPRSSLPTSVSPLTVAHLVDTGASESQCFSGNYGINWFREIAVSSRSTESPGRRNNSKYILTFCPCRTTTPHLSRKATNHRCLLSGRPCESHLPSASNFILLLYRASPSQRASTLKPREDFIHS